MFKNDRQNKKEKNKRKRTKKKINLHYRSLWYKILLIEAYIKLNKN